MKTYLLIVAFCTLSLGVIAQGWADDEPKRSSKPVFQETFVRREVQAVNYRHRDSTKIDFAGTELMPAASGHAKVDSERGAT